MASGDEVDALTVDVYDPDVPAVSWEEYRDAARAAGGGTELYVAEWDLVFSSEEDLREHYEETLAASASKLAVIRQASTGFEPTYTRPDSVDITYCVSTAFTNFNTVVADMATATQAWQRVTNVRFRYDSSQNATCNQNNGNVDFAVMPTTFPGLSGCGANKLLWPATQGACPLTATGPFVFGVLLMQYATFPAPPPSNGVTPAGTMTHELGHLLGFRHEHPWAPGQGGCSEAPTPPPPNPTDITGRRLTAYDQASVMHYPQCGGLAGLDMRISALDGVGARMIYKIPAAWHVQAWALGS